MLITKIARPMPMQSYVLHIFNLYNINFVNLKIIYNYKQLISLCSRCGCNSQSILFCQCSSSLCCLSGRWTSYGLLRNEIVLSNLLSSLCLSLCPLMFLDLHSVFQLLYLYSFNFFRGQWNKVYFDKEGHNSEDKYYVEDHLCPIEASTVIRS